VVFKIDPSGNETVLYSFTGGVDGGYPYGGSLLLGPDGSLYGTTTFGGSGFGVVFKVDSSGHETVLYTFTGGADGAYPNGVIRDSAGNLYGTANGGGASGAGVVYKLDLSGHETVLYTFTGEADGAYPSGVIRDSAGNFYSTASNGGDLSCNAPYGCGVVFKVDPSGNETVLYAFTGGADGEYPNAGLIFGPEGNLYGTTAFGGQTNAGVVFEIKP
jgi:uncharacterized repeat protein (TIGR03803 family)